MTSRYSSWSQGNILPSDAVDALHLDAIQEADELLWVVISHDCDLANSTKETTVELIPAIKINKPDSSSGYGKNPRILHIEYQLATADNIWLALDARSKCTVDKSQLFNFQPNIDIKLNGDGYTILQHWLASRYFRAAFPENFVTLISRATFTSKKDTLPNRIEKSMTVSGSCIRAILFDLDKGELIERLNTDVYELGIYVLYDSSKPNAHQEAEQIAESLTNDFELAFQKQNNWQGIRLEFCDPISDAVMTVAAQQNLKQWKLEHLSLSEDGVGTMLAVT